jgi:hypothetical protein
MSARRAPDSGPDLNGNFGLFFLMNLYTAISTYIYTPVSFTKVFGKEAVWIMERPTESSPAVGIFGPYQDLPLLSDFGSAIMIGAYAGRYEFQALPIISSISVRQPNKSR